MLCSHAAVIPLCRVLYLLFLYNCNFDINNNDDCELSYTDSENWSIRRIKTQYGVSRLLGVGSKNKIFQNFLELVWIRRIGPPGYGVLDLLDTAYRAYWVRRIELLRYGVLGSLGTAYWASWVWHIVHLGYGVLAESVLFLIFDQSIIYHVDTDVDMAYFSKSDNGLLIR
ncbi:hypothetical protein Tco_0529787 [Tanacetum coccineum]